MKGLVLEGGGVKGSYQIGSYYAFRDCKIKLNGYVGTSIGSFNAAMLASNKATELLEFWSNVNPGILLGFEQKFIDTVTKKDIDIKSLISSFSALKKVVLNFGLDNTKLLSEIEKVIDYEALESSNLDFGLVTVKVSRHEGIKPLYINKEDIKNKNKLLEYLMASSYFPAFREKRILDNHYYIDGGFYDNSPIKLLADKNYKDIYVINIKGIGINRKPPRNVKITYIYPSRDTGRILELNREIIKDNIMMGYYDTLRILKNLDGYKYCFKKRSNEYYKFITRKIPKRQKRRIKNFFNVNTTKEAVLKSLEYILEKEDIDYYNVYNSYKMIKLIRRIDNNHFIYQFVKKIKFF